MVLQNPTECPLLMKNDVAVNSVVTISYQSMVGRLLHAAGLLGLIDLMQLELYPDSTQPHQKPPHCCKEDILISKGYHPSESTLQSNR